MGQHNPKMQVDLSESKLDDLCSEVNKINLEEQNKVNGNDNGNAAPEPELDRNSLSTLGNPSGTGTSEASSNHPPNSNDEEEEDDAASDSDSEASYSTADPVELAEDCIEGENIIAEYRSKLFRFDSETKQWKERGVGQIRLLQSLTQWKKCRVIMWRDGNGLLACNFRLYPGINVANFQNNPKALCWKCLDNSSEPTWETFTCRFASEDDCANFKNKIMEYATDPPEPSHVISLIVKNDESETSSSIAEGNENDEAESEEKKCGDGGLDKSCSGCRGCEDSEFEFGKPIQFLLKGGEESVIGCDLNEDANKEFPKMVSASGFL